MKLFLFGHGKMGSLVEQLASNQGFTISDSLEGADVAIDFSHPDGVHDHIELAQGAKTNLVIGTTGWELGGIQNISDIGILFSPNFSLGMAAFMKVVEKAKELLKDYEIGGWEIHHSEKVDKPSGTGKHLEELLDIEMASVRVGKVHGTHSIIFDSPVDSVEITHRARSREGFALGALKAAKWLHGKVGFYTLNDMMGG